LSRSQKESISRAVLIFITFNNVEIIIQLWEDYIDANLNISLYQGELQTIIWGISIYLLSVCILYSFINLVRLVLGKRITPAFNKFFSTGAALFWIIILVVSLIYGQHVVLIDNSYIHFCTTKSKYLIPFLLIVITAIFYLFNNRPEMSREKRKSLNFILFQFLAGYLLFIFFSIFKTKFEIVPLLIRFYLNIVLVWWFTIYCVKTIVPLPSPISSELIIIIQEKFDLSKREQEVLHLILQGKNNKEIEDSLFISSSTVRNHVSAIYKKIGVKHRGQLIDLILKLQEQN